MTTSSAAVPGPGQSGAKVGAGASEMGAPTDVWAYRAIVVSLAAIAIGVLPLGYLIVLGVGDGATMPDSLIALGSAAIGALAGVIAPTPR